MSNKIEALNYNHRDLRVPFIREFNMKYTDKLFNVLKRWHYGDEFVGTYTYLRIIKLIVTRILDFYRLEPNRIKALLFKTGY